MKRRYFIVLLPAFLLLGAAFLFTRLQAQRGAAGMVVHPSNFDLTLSPGTPTTGTIYVDNATDKSLPIKVDTRNFTAEGEEGGVNLTEENTTYSLASWITVTPSTATIPARGTQEFHYTINAPANAEPGGHFGSVVFATVPSKTNTTGAALSQEVASLILARIPGNVNEQATLESFATDKSFYEFGPVQFDLRVRNEGAVHVRPSGEIVITDMLGNKTYLPFQGANVLPGAVRKMTDTLKSRFLIGKYKADLIAAYGDKNQQLTGSAEFTAFPVRYALVVLVILVLLFLMRRRLGRAIKAIATGK